MIIIKKLHYNDNNNYNDNNLVTRTKNNEREGKT